MSKVEQIARFYVTDAGYICLYYRESLEVTFQRASQISVFHTCHVVYWTLQLCPVFVCECRNTCENVTNNWLATTLRSTEIPLLTTTRTWLLWDWRKWGNPQLPSNPKRHHLARKVAFQVREIRHWKGRKTGQRSNLPQSNKYHTLHRVLCRQGKSVSRSVHDYYQKQLTINVGTWLI